MRPARLLPLAGLVLMPACGGDRAPAPPAPAAAPAAAAARVTFTDVTEAAGVRFRHVNGAFGKKYLPETMGSGVSVLDHDGDGRPDLFFVNGARWPNDPSPEPRRGASSPPALLRNRGDGTFADVTAEAGLADTYYGMGAAAADYDNDGDTDLFVTALGRDRLYRNDGARFTEVGMQAGVADPGFGSSAAFLDYDHDGDVDLFVCNYVQWTIDTDLFCSLDGQSKSYCTPESYRGESSRLYRNEGGGRFSDVSKRAGVLNPAGKSLGVAVIDFDDDGWEDIAVANDTQPNSLYRNNRDGTFADVGRESGIAFSEAGVARGAMGIDAADYDGSGRESLVIGNFSNEMVGLYHNEGAGLFIDDAARAGVGLPSLLTLAFGCFFFDYDLDGSTDIFVANGHVEDDINRVQKEITHAQRPHLFRNKGDGTFDPVRAPEEGGGPLVREYVARGAAYLDYDADGDLDVALTTNNGPAHLLRNDGGTGHGWLRVKLVGSRSNRDGIGARIRLTTGGRVRTAAIRSGSSYCSQSELVATFGLGPSASPERLEVQWPSGDRQAVEVPARDTTLVLREGERQRAASPPASRRRPGPSARPAQMVHDRGRDVEEDRLAVELVPLEEAARDAAHAPQAAPLPPSGRERLELANEQVLEPGHHAARLERGEQLPHDHPHQVGLEVVQRQARDDRVVAGPLGQVLDPARVDAHPHPGRPGATHRVPVAVGEGALQMSREDGVDLVDVQPGAGWEPPQDLPGEGARTGARLQDDERSPVGAQRGGHGARQEPGARRDGSRAQEVLTGLIEEQACG